ncbi:PH domain-containing protein [Alkalicoccobacillus porphyridii]|uniref:YokE-like PH domain-containing protein n=1 Tax=Alkalicoccobacillus porphyridii TaxID=2597270 RepID=A0A554A3C3_9BACI|nr:PH domain-containing protein [Alkalicoccobacillus porphyridii]TSB48175.1 hypothetical protein FN960_01060 [Alkalicoccobacillus porphyridii]
MHTHESIKKRFEEVGVTGKYGTKKEIKELPKILTNDEIVNYATSGFLGSSTWLVVSTNKRVIFLDKGMIYGLKQKEIALDKINSIAQKRGMLLGEIHIWDGAESFNITHCDKGTIQPFIDATNKAIDALKTTSSTVAATTETSGFSKIKELKELLDMGAISEEEFKAQKEKILN